MYRKPLPISVALTRFVGGFVGGAILLCFVLALVAVHWTYQQSTVAFQNMETNRLTLSLERFLVSGTVVEVDRACHVMYKTGIVEALRVETPEHGVLCALPRRSASHFPMKVNTKHYQVQYGASEDARSLAAHVYVNFQDKAFQRFARWCVYFFSSTAPFWIWLVTIRVRDFNGKKIAPISQMGTALLDPKWELGVRFQHIRAMPSPDDDSSHEALMFHQTMCQVGAQYAEVEKLKTRTARAEGMAELAAQVAHDICSPLVALKLALQNQEEAHMEQRMGLISSAIQQISDISNRLLEQRRALLIQEKLLPPDTSESATASDTALGRVPNGHNLLQSHLIFPVVEEEMGIKKLQYCREMGSGHLELRYIPSPGVQNAFVRMNPLDLKTVLSNLINNAVEALPNGKGTVTVYLERDAMQKRVLLIVEDTGVGMTAPVLAQVLQGHSIGKKRGNGIGLLSSKKKVESWGGLFEIHTMPGEGTRIHLDFWAEVPPAWFQEYLAFPIGATIVVVDDDRSIHEMWKVRWETCYPGGAAGIQWVYLYSVEELMAQPELYRDKKAYFLMDYEIRSSEQNGLEVLQSLGVVYQASLVSTHYADPALQKKCEQIGCRILPKPYIVDVPLEVMAKYPELVLVHEAIEIVRLWEATSRTLSEYLAVCSNGAHLRWILEELPRHVPIYVSVYFTQTGLGEDGMPREDLAQVAHMMGFLHIYIVDADCPGESQMPDPNRAWVESVVGVVYPALAPYKHRRSRR